MDIKHFTTSGKFRLEGKEWDVDNNVYIVGDDTGVFIVDPAHDPQAVIDAVGNRPVEDILLSHAHNDHCEIAPQLAAHYDTAIYLHPDDKQLWEETNGDAEFTELEDRQRILLAGEPIQVLHTPGHSPGCVVFYLPSEDTLLSGDTLFSGGPGATGRKYSDFDTIIQSLQNVVFKLPEDTKVLPGHGDSTTVGAEAARIDEYIERGY